MTFVAITSYFNPCDYKTKEANYVTFRRALERAGVSVLCVEQGFDHAPRVGNPLDLYISGGDVLWQKECLLQIGIDHCLANSDRDILLLDCDVMFESADAFETIENAFGHCDCFQPFDQIALHYSGAIATMSSVASLRVGSCSFASAHPGSAFAGTRDFFSRVRLYPYALLGGGDLILSYLLFLCVTYGPHSTQFCALSEFCVTKRLCPSLGASVLNWVEAVCSANCVFGRVRGVSLRSLAHGCQRRRNYGGRYDVWSRTGPVPNLDFRVGTKGLLEWLPHVSSDWRRVPLEYFSDRAEDDCQ